MANSNIIIDTGAIIAFLNKKDPYNSWVVDCLKQANTPLITTQPVISESFFLLQRLSKGGEALSELLSSKLIEILLDAQKELKSILKLISKYRDTPMSFADATLVRLFELKGNYKILTLDSDFKVYKANRNKTIDCIIP